MASSSISRKQLDDITECPICTEVYTDPRVLPCVHTYCLRCLEGWCKDKHPGDEVQCPLCRKELVIPCEGLQGLPKNFFIEKLLNVKELSGAKGSESPCDVCSSRSEDSENNTATFYCLECQEKLCDNCRKIHMNMKATRAHNIVKLGEELSSEEIGSKSPSAYCNKHREDVLRIYCFDCKLAICIMCFIGKHKAHNCSDIQEISDEFRGRLDMCMKKVTSGIEKCRDMLENLSKHKKDYVDQISRAEKQVCDRAEELRTMIERHKQKLLNDLGSARDTKLKEFEEVNEKLEIHLAAMEGFRNYVDKLVEKGTPCDIVQSEDVLHSRAEELLMLDSSELALADLEHNNVTFTSSSPFPYADDAKNTIGCLTIGDIRKGVENTDTKQPTLSHLVPKGNVIRGVTSVGSDVFVVRDGVREVEVYDTTTLTLQRRLNVPGLGTQPWGLTSCKTNNCLYISDYDNNVVHRVDLSGNQSVTTWSVSSGPAGLSVNSSRNVVVACRLSNKIMEYITDGTHVREINLQGVTYPFNTVQLSSDQLVVTVDISKGDVYLVDNKGRVLKSLSQIHGCSSLLGYTAVLDVSSSGFIAVVDYSGNKIISINPSLTCAQQLPLPIDGGLKSPWCVYLDESRDRLYVGEHSQGGRLLVFQNVLGLINSTGR